MSLRKTAPPPVDAAPRIEDVLWAGLDKLSLRGAAEPAEPTGVHIPGANNKAGLEKVQDLGLKINPARSRVGLPPMGIDPDDPTGPDKALRAGGEYRLNRILGASGVYATQPDIDGGHMVGIINRNSGTYGHRNNIGEYLTSLGLIETGLFSAMSTSKILYSRPVSAEDTSSYINAARHLFQVMNEENRQFENETAAFTDANVQYRAFYNVWIFMSPDTSEKRDAQSYLCLGRFRVTNYDGQALALERANDIPDPTTYKSNGGLHPRPLDTRSAKTKLANTVANAAEDMLNQATDNDRRAGTLTADQTAEAEAALALVGMMRSKFPNI